MPLDEQENTESIIKAMKLECNAYKITDEEILKWADEKANTLNYLDEENSKFNKKKFSSLFDAKLAPE